LAGRFANFIWTVFDMLFACGNARFAGRYAISAFGRTAVVHGFTGIGTCLTTIDATFASFNMMRHNYLFN
jgi:hypothetical protein